VDYIKKVGRAVSTGEIIEEALGLGKVPLNIRNTISSRLYAEAQSINGVIQKGSRGTFELRIRQGNG